MNDQTTTTFLGHTISRENVLRAIRAYDNAPGFFLQHAGFGQARRYFLRHAGKSYPSKAILGVACGLHASRFYGGIRGTVRVLERLGFKVRDAKTGMVVDGELEGLRFELEAKGLDVDPTPWPDLPVDPSAYYASGSNRPADIRALAAAGADIGVTVSELSEAGIQELEALAGSDVRVFVDSGAFSEVRPSVTGVLEVVAEIRDWPRRLSIYRRLAKALRSQVSLVAPDKVGDQAGTLERLSRFAGELQELKGFGAEILVPIQKGELEPADFFDEVHELLPFGDWTPALPCKKAAFTVADVETFVLEVDPSRLHLLGLGVRSRLAPAYLDAIRLGRSSVSLDSCWIAANVGRDVKGGRRLTRARDASRRLLGDGAAPALIAALGLFACWG